MDTSTLKSNYHKYRNKEVGFVFQNFSLLDDYTVIENVMLPLIYRRISHKKRIQISKEMLEMVGLEGILTNILTSYQVRTAKNSNSKGFSTRYKNYTC